MLQTLHGDDNISTECGDNAKRDLLVERMSVTEDQLMCLQGESIDIYLVKT